MLSSPKVYCYHCNLTYINNNFSQMRKKYLVRFYLLPDWQPTELDWLLEFGMDAAGGTGYICVCLPFWGTWCNSRLLIVSALVFGYHLVFSNFQFKQIISFYHACCLWCVCVYGLCFLLWPCLSTLNSDVSDLSFCFFMHWYVSCQYSE